MSKSLQLLKELLEEDKFDIEEVMEVLGYEIIKHDETEIFSADVLDTTSDGSIDVPYMIGYDEVITIKKEHR